jgi:hypothetical protein
MSPSATASAAPAIPASASKDEMLVPVFNKSPKGGDYVHLVYEEIKDSEGRVVGRKQVREWRAQAGVFSRIPEWLARIWKRQAPQTIVDGKDIGAPPTVGEKSAEIITLERQHDDDDRRIKNLEKLVADLRGQHLA